MFGEVCIVGEGITECFQLQEKGPQLRVGVFDATNKTRVYQLAPGRRRNSEIEDVGAQFCHERYKRCEASARP